MSIFKRLIKSKALFNIESKETNTVNSITAKEKQLLVIKEYLKPILKQHGYFTSGQTWWRDQGDFYIIINLQNFSWNTKNDVTFCFNIGIGLKSLMKDSSQKPRYSDLTIFIRDGAYLSDSRKVSIYKNNNGYIIKERTDIDEFIVELKLDFENEILPKLEKLVTLNNCVEYYDQFPFLGERLKELIKT